MSTVAVYRILYGQDFIVESIRSILPRVEQVFVCWDDRPWHPTPEVIWDEGVPFDGWKVRIDKMVTESRQALAKIRLHYFHVETPVNQFTRMVNEVVIPALGKVPERVICLEPDHVWDQGELTQAFREFDAAPQRCGISRQIEIWKTPSWRVPERPTRTGTVFWDLKGLNGLPPTNRQAEYRGTDICHLRAQVHNMGFAVSEESMRRKHEVAIAISAAIKDSRPNPLWFENVWRVWHPAMRELEIAEGYEYMIPHAIPYNAADLPQVLLKWSEMNA